VLYLNSGRRRSGRNQSYTGLDGILEDVIRSTIVFITTRSRSSSTRRGSTVGRCECPKLLPDFTKSPTSTLATLHTNILSDLFKIDLSKLVK
jgi:hypothetical protein